VGYELSADVFILEVTSRQAAGEVMVKGRQEPGEALHLSLHARFPPVCSPAF